ncbi:MAG: sulfatase [Bacteroidales bacterium]|nr:sulfatase [Bacteroidales bacterium]
MISTGCHPGSSKEDGRKNVLFIAVDDLRPALGCYGDSLAITPNIDRLSEQGVVFSRAYVQAPSCAPSRTSMLTGLRPDEVKVTDHKTHFRDTRPDVVTLPQIFKLSDYETMSIGKIFHFARGYNDTVSWTRPELYVTGIKKEQYVLPENRTGGKAASTECAGVHDTAYWDGKFAKEAIRFLKEVKEQEKNFFLGVGFLKPHLPFSAPEKYWDLYDRSEFHYIENRDRPLNAPEIAFHNWHELRGYTDIPGDGPLSAEKEKQLWHAYYACVSYIDAQIGKVLNTLDELELRENTIIVLWGDHGYHLGEQNLWCKSTNFELSAHAPIIIAAPGIGNSGMTSNAIVESLDLYPTLIDLCGLKPEGTLSGVSLKPLLVDPESKWKNIAFNQFARPYEAAIGGNKPVSHMGYSVRTDEWRYTAWYNVNTGSFEYPELYSIQGSKIPSENLAGNPEYADTESRLHNLVQEYKDGNY